MATKIAVKNTNSLNFLKVRLQKRGAKGQDWSDAISKFVKPGDSEEVNVDYQSQRLIIEEMPS